jgi:hypothetical protein
MIQQNIRFIYSVHTQWEIKDLLQSIFMGELLSPSRCIWLVSPWISDIQIIDNRSNQCTTIEPDWARKQVYLTDLITKLGELGSVIRIATRKDKHNDRFLSELKRKSDKLNKNIFFYENTILHEKGILGDQYYLSGSMNLTQNGIAFTEESLKYITDRSMVSENRITFSSRWGDEQV